MERLLFVLLCCQVLVVCAISITEANQNIGLRNVHQSFLVFDVLSLSVSLFHPFGAISTSCQGQAEYRLVVNFFQPQRTLRISSPGIAFLKSDKTQVSCDQDPGVTIEFEEGIQHQGVETYLRFRLLRGIVSFNVTGFLAGHYRYNYNLGYHEIFWTLPWHAHITDLKVKFIYNDTFVGRIWYEPSDYISKVPFGAYEMIRKDVVPDDHVFALFGFPDDSRMRNQPCFPIPYYASYIAGIILLLFSIQSISILFIVIIICGAYYRKVRIEARKQNPKFQKNCEEELQSALNPIRQNANPPICSTKKTKWISNNYIIILILLLMISVLLIPNEIILFLLTLYLENTFLTSYSILSRIILIFGFIFLYLGNIVTNRYTPMRLLEFEEFKERLLEFEEKKPQIIVKTYDTCWNDGKSSRETNVHIHELPLSMREIENENQHANVDLKSVLRSTDETCLKGLGRNPFVYVQFDTEIYCDVESKEILSRLPLKLKEKNCNVHSTMTYDLDKDHFFLKTRDTPTIAKIILSKHVFRLFKFLMLLWLLDILCHWFIYSEIYYTKSFEFKIAENDISEISE